MTREELKKHCEKKVEICKKLATINGEKPSGQIYEEHKLILELLENEKFMNKPCISIGVCEHDKDKALDKIRAEIEKLQKMCDKNDLNLLAQYSAFGMVLDIFDKYKAEIEQQRAR